MSTGQQYNIGSDHCPGLSKLIEECGECLQVAGKIIGFGGFGEHWDGSNLQERLMEEMADLEAAIMFVKARNLAGPEAFTAFRERVQQKYDLFCKWHWEVEHGIKSGE